eukprot:TRINITY_DN2529_c0_g1_i1.p1 TRINITY_DN2529_c0_g1~~TRINITY_DN2529_c0_g1_i1.p1  ORF type:complete len:416 (-),score=114.24 TRINITY_DN2529_c0_g1_i1:97-1344(-)
MIQSLFILNGLGDILIEKHYRGLLNRNICDLFWDEVRKAPKPEDVLPVIQTPKFFLVHIQRNGLFFLSVVATETPPLLILEFLHRVCDVFGQYFDPRFGENQMRDNFVTVYQLIDEMMDNGFPFTTEPNALMEMIPPTNKVQKMIGNFTGNSNMSGVLSEGTLSNTPWRKTGVRYAANEIYFDIIEEIDSTIDTNGLPINCEVNGEVQVNCKLSGMPDLTLVFTNAAILDDVSFHPCVRYTRWEQSRVISFVPPDGNFKLMSYRVKGQLQMPIYVKPQINLGIGGKVNIMCGPKNTQGKTIEEVCITIPFPKTTSTTNLTANYGYINYDDMTKVAKWHVGRLPVNKTPMLEGTVSFPPNVPAGDNVHPTLQAEFKGTMLSITGLKVDTLSVHNEKYKPFKGVRNITKAGKFYVRS